MGRNAEMEVVIDPRFRIPYYTYILEGLIGSGYRVTFRSLDRPLGGGMALLHKGRKVWVDTNDMAEVDRDAYGWADIMGKANCTEPDVARLDRLQPLGPVFGVRYWTLTSGYLAGARLVLRGAPPRSTLAGIRFQGKTRLPLRSYVSNPSNVDLDFVYHRSRSWAGKHAGTNDSRERFIEALGLAGIGGETALTDERVPLQSYLERTSKSMLVFNSPAVHDCLGWKLGEYLAMGKAIVSTELNRALPEPLIHGTHIHLVRDDVSDIAEAILQIRSDAAYRAHLEREARAWFERVLAPAAVVHRLFAP